MIEGTHHSNGSSQMDRVFPNQHKEIRSHSNEYLQDLEVDMGTALENELIEAGYKCEIALNRLYNLGLTRYMAHDDFNFFIEELNYLLYDIDEISNLIVSVRNAVREAEYIREMLMCAGFTSHSKSLIQVNSMEQLNARELREILLMIDEKVISIGDRLREYNSSLRQLYERRKAGIESRMLMNLAGFPGIRDLPRPLSPGLLDQIYNEPIRLQQVPKFVGASRIPR